MRKYNIDGLRIDAAKSIPFFFAQLVNNCTDSYAVGEVFDGDASYSCAYQTGGLDGFLNFPVYYAVLNLTSPPDCINTSDGRSILLIEFNPNGRFPGTNSFGPRRVS